MSVHFAQPLREGDSFNGYVVVKEIGSGGFGVVYEARHETLPDRVAIKQFLPQNLGSWRQGTLVIRDADAWATHQRILKRFEAEATLQFTFSHPNILKVRNFIKDPAGTTGYMFADFIDGTTLTKFLVQHNNVFSSEEMLRKLMEPIAEAIAYAHERQTLHRDIAPDNIMIDKSQKPVLVDFGAAKLDLRRNSKQTSETPFKEAYSPIEQRAPSDDLFEGRYTDIFAFAGTMYHLISGELPKLPLTRALVDPSKDPYVPLALVAKTPCSEQVYEAIDFGLAVRPPDRPQTVETFMEHLGWRLSTPAGQKEIEAWRKKKQSLKKPEPVPEVVIPPVRILPPGPEPEPIVEPRRSRVPGYMAVVALVAAVAGGLYFSSTPPSSTVPSVASVPSSPAIIPKPTPTVTVTPAYVPARPTFTPSPTPTYVPPPVAVPTATPTYVPPRPPPQPRYVTYENHDIEGGDLPPRPPHYTNVDQSTCESACNNNSQCIGYSYGKWDRACYLKGNLPDLRLEPNSTAVIRSNQPEPPPYVGATTIVATKRSFIGNRYSTSGAPTRKACSELCFREEQCVGYQYVSGSCWRYSQIDSATKDETAQSGVKRQDTP